MKLNNETFLAIKEMHLEMLQIRISSTKRLIEASTVTVFMNFTHRKVISND